MVAHDSVGPNRLDARLGTVGSTANVLMARLGACPRRPRPESQPVLRAVDAGTFLPLMAAQDPSSRAQRATRLAAEYDVDDGCGTGRYAAVVLRDGRAELARGDDIDGLLALGELVALVDLDYDALRT
jgi:hypothetical protein